MSSLNYNRLIAKFIIDYPIFANIKQMSTEMQLYSIMLI